MKSSTKILIITAILSSFFIAGCASLMRNVFIGKDEIKMPQVVAYLKPFLKENQIFVVGEIVIENPTESDLELEKVFLSIVDNDNRALDKVILQWKDDFVKSKNRIAAPLEVKLDLAALKKEHVAFFLKTRVFYKDLDIYIPIKSKIAVLDFSLLKENIIRPLELSISSKLRSDITGKSAIDFFLEISNPTEVDLFLKKGVVKIYSSDNEVIAESSMPRILLKAHGKSQIDDSIDLGNIFRTIVSHRLFKLQPLKLEISGELIALEADISMPFLIVSTQELDFSFEHKE